MTRETRQAKVRRKTSETDIELSLSLDGTGRVDVDTGLGFFNHMLTALGRHGRFDLALRCEGDLDIDDHHTVEDCALTLGQAFDEALGDRRGIQRFASAYAPLDEALARVVIDLSGRPAPVIHLGLSRDKIGDVSCENLHHFFISFAHRARAAIHVDVLRGDNDHHRAEAAFKALALALRQAVASDGTDEVPSTKGVL
jgi:imidazoleglycerol-phosphate dehydratase